MSCWYLPLFGAHAYHAVPGDGITALLGPKKADIEAMSFWLQVYMQPSLSFLEPNGAGNF